MTRKGERRLSPQRLARLANALGVSTPLPVSSKSQHPSISTSNSFLLHVLPPPLLADPRGSLLPLHSSLHAQLTAIAREYALPSTLGLILYLISDTDNSDGPRLSDDIWKTLWSRVVSVERSPSPLRPLTCSPDPSTPSFVRSPFNSDPPTPDSSIHTPSLLRLPGLTSPSLLPILAKVQFQIDKRKATWYTPWITRLNKKSTPAPRQLLTLKPSHLKKLSLSPHSNVEEQEEEDDEDEDEDELDEDATATFPTLNRGSTNSHEGFSTKEEEVLEMLETMSVRSKSRSTSTSSSTHSSLVRNVVLPPLVINSTIPNSNNDDPDMELSYLAYTEPLPSPVPELDQSFPIISNKEQQGGKREFAVFDDLELEFDHTLDIDDDDPNDRRKSQLIMRAKLDEIERTMAQLSPRMLHSDLSLSPDRASMRVSPTSPNCGEFLSPRMQIADNSFITSSPPRLGFRNSDQDNPEDKSWPAIPFSAIKEQEQSQRQPSENANPNALPPPPRLAVNGVSTVPPRAFVPAPTRPPPPLPLTGIGSGMAVPLTETEKRKRELEEDQGVYQVTLRSGGEVIPLSPDPFGRYPSSTTNEPPHDITGEVPETRARSGTVTTTASKSRFSADSGDEPIPAAPAGGLRPTSNRTTLMSVKTIKKLWRRSKEKEKNLSSGGASPPPPTPVTPTSATSNDFDKSLPSIPPPRPSRPSEEQLDFPDISLQAVLPPQLTPSPTPRLSSRPLMQHNGDSVNGGGSGRRTPQEQLALPPPSRPSLDQPTAPSPPPALTHQQPGSGTRTPQDQLTFLPPSQPLLDQLPPPPQQPHPGSGGGRRTPQDQLMFRPPSRPSLDQQPSHLRHPSQPQVAQQQLQQLPMQMPMFQGRNPHNGPVTPLLAMHYPSRSSSVSQQQQTLDVNRLLFDQESPYPVRLASFAGGTVASAAAVTPTTKVATAASYAGGGARASPPPPPQPPQPTSVEPEKPTTTTISTMRKSILKWKLANPNANINSNSTGNFNQGSSDTSSSSSSSSTSSSIVGGSGAVPRQSFERFERPGVAGSNGGYGHHHARGGGGGGGRRPSVINFGSTSSLSSSTSVSSNRGGTDIPRNPQVPAQYSTMPSASPSGGESKPNHVHFESSTTNPHPSISTPIPSPINTNSKPPPSLSIQNPNDLQPNPSPQSLSPSRQSFDSPSSAVERRSNASSFDMTQFEFVSPVPVSASAPTHGSLRI